MQPPHRDHHPWQDDHLGTLLRQGMPRSWRNARPSPEVWQRIACEISPCPPPARSRWTGWLRPAQGRPRMRGGPRWVSFSSSAFVLSAAMVVGVLMFGDVAVLQQRVADHPCLDHVAAGCGVGIAPERQGLEGQGMVLAPPEREAGAPVSAAAGSGATSGGPRIAGVPAEFRVALVDPVALMDPVALVQPVESLTPASRWTFRFAAIELAPDDKRARQSGEETQATWLFGGRRTAPPACPARGQWPDAGPATTCIY